MADFIDRAAVLTEIYQYTRHHWPTVSYVESIIKKTPAADVEPVRHGRWEQSIFAEDFKRCSVCSSIWSRTSNYCPHCGAKMDGGGEDAGD